MPQQSTRFDFGDSFAPKEDFVLLENIIEDRGSRYAVSYGMVQNRAEIKVFLQRLKKKKKYGMDIQKIYKQDL